jgi:hypothetical protein
LLGSYNNALEPNFIPNDHIYIPIASPVGFIGMKPGISAFVFQYIHNEAVKMTTDPQTKLVPDNAKAARRQWWRWFTQLRLTLSHNGQSGFTAPKRSNLCSK